MNIATLLAQTARRIPDAPALSSEGECLSYSEFEIRVAALADGLRRRMETSAGGRVGLAMENCPEFLIALFAIWQAGLVAVPMNAKLIGRDFVSLLDDCGASLCLATPKQAAAIAETAEGASSRCSLVSVTGAKFQELQAGTPMAPVETVPDDLAWLFYTSGTTGKPKGAMLSHRNLLFMIHAYLADIDQVDERDTMLHAAPLSHGAGLYALAHIIRGSHQHVLSGSFDVDAIFAAIAERPNVSIFGAPTMVNRLVAAASRAAPDLRNLRTVIYGGGPMYVADLKRAYDVFGPRLYQLYGQGESPMTITGLDQRQHAEAMRNGRDDHLASCGIARTGVAVAIADEEGRVLPPGGLGEVITRSDCVMAGYWNNSEASRSTLKNGWLHTGDIGSMSEQGFVTLRDRSKDLIISGGTNIYPREIEEILLSHPAVAEVAVVGQRDPEWGERVVAFVAARRPELTTAELDALCLSQLARFKRPREYVFLDELPKNSYGKILKRELRNRLDHSKDF